MARFTAKTERDPVTGCLMWTAGKNSEGYGYFKVAGRQWRAIRWIFRHDHGYLPEVVRHACDTPACVELQHLLPGTQADNMTDRDNRGRHWARAGEMSGQAKLGDQEVKEIRTEYAKGILTQRMLGEIYGVTSTHISRIVNRKIRVRGTV